MLAPGPHGPCADALVAAGVARCVVATVDPNPQVRGRGLARLRAAGVAVEVATGALCLRARRLNDGFACSIQTGRPLVVLKAALSVDGRLAPPPAERAGGQPHWVTGPAARASVQPLRHRVDAVLTGLGTVLADDPLLTDRTGEPRRRPLLRVVLDHQLRLPLGSQLVRSAAQDVLVVCAADAPQDAERALLAAGVAVQRVAELEPAAVLAQLATRGCTSVLVEAGAQVNGAMLRAGLVDELWLYYAEQEFGAQGVPFAAGFDSPYAVQQRLTSVTRSSFAHGAGEDVLVRGYLRDPWLGVE